MLALGALVTAGIVGLVVPNTSAAPVAASSGVPTDDEAAARAAREISAARERANAAADELFRTASRLDLLGEERERLEREIEGLREEVDELRRSVEAAAVARFASSGASGIPLLTDVRTPNDRVQADVLVAVIADAGATSLDDFEAARDRLDEAEDALDRTEADLLQTEADLEEQRIGAEAEVDRLRSIEQARLQDEAVRRALEAQQREAQRQLEEFQRREAEAARRAAPTPAATPAAILGSSGITSGNTGASGGTAGGSTGGGGGGSNPAASGSGYVDAIICPVQGTSAWGDTWGAPRSGGRRHQGVDMLAATGTPLQAVVSGVVEFRSNRLGGLTVSLMGDNGNRYYYAHLSGYEGAPGPVAQGQVVGYVGDTGNATGVPHLHFEIRPGNSVPVNPTPSVRAAGC